MSHTNVEPARRGYEALKRGDFAEVGELLNEDVKRHGSDPMAGGACRNRKQALAFMGRAERRGPGELIDVIDEERYTRCRIPAASCEVTA